MKKLNLLIAALFLITLGFSTGYSQEDSTQTGEDEDWHWHWKWSNWDEWNDWNFDLGFNHSKPAISLQYGLAQLGRKNISSELSDPNLIELKLGYMKDINAWKTDYIIKHNYQYLYLSNESNRLSGKKVSGADIESDMWRFGFGKSEGYGYKLGSSSAIILYNSNTINWSRIDFQYPDILTFANNPDINVLNLYDESFRFGTSSEGGIRIKLVDNVMLDAGYERSIVFQRHLFWKWAGSGIIEMASQGLLDGFIHEIFKSSPAAGPIVSFVLKNALSYGIYELRQEKMNWPFKTEAPISYDQFKFGLTFVF